MAKDSNESENLNKLLEKFPNCKIKNKDAVGTPIILVEVNDIVDVAHFLKNDESQSYDYLACLGGAEYKEHFSVIYNLHSMTRHKRLTLQVNLPKDNPKVLSVSEVWKTADWHERETYDMYGIIFINHPNLKRILCPDDWEGFTLRKDFKLKEPQSYLVLTEGKLPIQANR